MLWETHLCYIVTCATTMLARREDTGNLVYDESSAGTLDFCYFCPVVAHKLTTVYILEFQHCTFVCTQELLECYYDWEIKSRIKIFNHRFHIPAFTSFFFFFWIYCMLAAGASFINLACAQKWAWNVRTFLASTGIYQNNYLMLKCV